MDTIITTINPAFLRAVQDTVLNYGEPIARASATPPWFEWFMLACALALAVIALMGYIEWRCDRLGVEFSERVYVCTRFAVETAFSDHEKRSTGGCACSARQQNPPPGQRKKNTRRA